MTVITQRNKDPIDARYERLLDGGTKPTLAKLSLARIIAATAPRIWKDEKESRSAALRIEPSSFWQVEFGRGALAPSRGTRPRGPSGAREAGNVSEKRSGRGSRACYTLIRSPCAGRHAGDTETQINQIAK